MSAMLNKLVAEDSRAGVEPGWLTELRRDARQRIEAHGFPDVRTEDWKYTSLKLLEKRELAVEGDSPREPLPALPVDGLVLDCFNGRMQFVGEMPTGVRLTPMNEAGDSAGLARDYGQREAAFAWTNTARFEEGWLLDIEGQLDRPVILVIRTSDDFAGATHPRFHFRLAADASARLVEMSIGGGSGLCNSLLDVSLGSGARLDHARLQHAGSDCLLIQRCDVSVGRNGAYHWRSLDLGGRLVRHDLNIGLDEPEAGCSVNGAFVAAGRAHVDHHTRIDHRVGPSYSEENIRGILSGRSHGVFNGKIIVHKGADGSASEMNNANLLLSRHAEIDTKPELEIYADEVTAAHGATVGQLDADALFYLRSRGVPGDEAVGLLKQAFAADIIAGVEPEGLRHDWLARLQEALNR